MMNLSPTELERLTLFTAAELARRYRSQGVRLRHPEAIALITDEVLTAARRGLAHADLVALGGNLPTTDDVEPGVGTMIPFIAMEANMEQGTKLVAIFDPVKAASLQGDVHRKLGKKDMLHNAALPHIEVDPQTLRVYADGKLLHVEPAARVPLCRKCLPR